MSKPTHRLIITAMLIVAASPQNLYAQDAFQNEDVLIEAKPVQHFRHKRIVRDVKPIPYWVDSTSLRLRDNPIAGKAVGNLEYGQKVMAYAKYENWVRVSKNQSKAQWVNSDFLSNSRLTWANYNHNTPTRSSDVIAVRIKDPGNRKNRIFGVRLKIADTGNALITTRENTAKVTFYKNHFVSCKNQRAIGVRLIGEGSNFLWAQNDVLNLGLDIYNPDQIDDKANNSAEAAISAFACKAQSF